MFQQPLEEQGTECNSAIHQHLNNCGVAFKHLLK